MAQRPDKLIVIGVDGLMPELVERFVEDGSCPHLARLLGRGATAEILPSPPCDTPTNWTSLATGTWTGTHGNNSFGVHRPGEPFGELHDLGPCIFPRQANAAPEYLSRLASVEWIWQAAARAGRRAIVVNYPGGWPPNAEGVVFVDGTGPLASPLARLCGPHVFATREAKRPNATHRLHTAPPSGWRELPESPREPRELALLVTGEASLEPTAAGWIVSRDGNGTQQVDPNLIYCGLILASGEGEGEAPYDTVVITRGRDLEHPVARLRAGEWTDWLEEEVATPYGPRRARFQLGLLALCPRAREVVLCRTAMFTTEGWAAPEGIAEELIGHVLQTVPAERGEPEGPGDEHRPPPEPSPLCQVTESTEDQARSLAATCEYLAGSREWDLLITQIHAPDGVLHNVLNRLCPASPQYTPDGEAEAWAAVRRELVAVDSLIGRVVESCADEEVAVAVVSDHGSIPTRKRVWLGKWLTEAGLLAYVAREDGKWELDWSRTSVVLGDHPLAQNLWVNLKGRDPDGIVPPESYEQVRSHAICALLSARDPETGECPVALALRKEEAEFLGQWGPQVGDIVYYLAPGYTNDVRIHSAGVVDPMVVPEEGLAPNSNGMQGIHHAYLPTARLGGFSVRGVLVMSGPGVRRAYRRTTAGWTPDVAPTLCALLGMPAPKDAEGAVLADMLQGE